MSSSRSAKRPGDRSDSPSKKVRFDTRDPSKLAAEESEEDEEDLAVLGLDSIGKAAGTTKRSAVNLDGFDSDSDNDNFNQRAADRAKAQKASQKDKKDAEDDDMFASEDEDKDDEEDEDTAVKKKKSVKFVDNKDIAGQEWSSTARNHVDFDITDQSGRVQDVKDVDTDSESGGDEGRDLVEDDDDAQELGAGAKKKHAPRLDAFNMKSEGEEGKFDESGNFVRRTDPNAIHDSWLEGVSKKEMKKAKEAEEKREEERRRKTREKDAVLTSDLLGTLITHLEKGESVLEALQRLGKPKTKQKPKWQKNKRERNAMDLDGDEHAQELESKRKEAVEAITEAADQLLSRGKEEIYETERELLQRMYKRETGDDWVDPENADDSSDEDGISDQWQFRWLDARDDGTLHGPYDIHTMRSWSDAGYFADGNVEFRRSGQPSWTKVMEFV